MGIITKKKYWQKLTFSYMGAELEKGRNLLAETSGGQIRKGPKPLATSVNSRILGYIQIWSFVVILIHLWLMIQVILKYCYCFYFPKLAKHYLFGIPDFIHIKLQDFQGGGGLENLPPSLLSRGVGRFLKHKYCFILSTFKSIYNYNEVYKALIYN